MGWESERHGGGGEKKREVEREVKKEVGRDRT